MIARLSESEREHAAHIVALFSVLVHSWQTNDFHEAARTRDQLEHFGVRVKMPRRRKEVKRASE